MDKLVKQWQKLISNPTIENNLNNDLYEFLYIKCDFIAHFDRSGFFKARFTTLNDFDNTIETMQKNKNCDPFFKSVSIGDISWARYKIASAEAARLKAQSKVLQYHIDQLQAKFQVPL